MSIERRGGKIEIACDVCGEVHETGTDEWELGWPVAKREGWRAQKIGKEWLHCCGDCEL